MCFEGKRLVGLIGVLIACCGSAGAENMNQLSISGCPGSPNCVSSQSRDPAHYVSPLQLEVSPELAWEKLKLVLREEQGLAIVAEEREAWYLRIEATSRVFRFVDDVEFQIVPAEKVVHVRSASRVGYWDFGVNRRRVDRIRERLRALGVVSA